MVTVSFNLLLTLLTTFSLFFALSYCFLVPLRNHDDSLFGWKFPKNRPYHYFNHTGEIPESFLPVQIDAIPKGDGLWVLRYKDFSGEPKTFSADKSKDSSKSVLTFSPKSSLFNSVSIKALGFGDAELIANFGTTKVSLFQYNKNCTNSNHVKDENGLKWIIYQVQVPPTSHLRLEAVIHHAKSFIILDEILVYFGNTHESADSDSNSDSHENAEEETKNSENRVFCRVVV